MSKAPKVGDVLWFDTFGRIAQGKVICADGDWLFVKAVGYDAYFIAKTQDIARPERVEAKMKDHLRDCIYDALSRPQSLAALEAALAAMDASHD